METDNEEFNSLCWESLKGRYEKKLEEDNDDEVVKNFKKAIKASDEYKRREAIALFACAVVFVVFSLGLIFTKETESIIYKIIMAVEGGLFLIMLVFATLVPCTPNFLRRKFGASHCEEKFTVTGFLVVS